VVVSVPPGYVAVSVPPDYVVVSVPAAAPASQSQ
jgi:hypothetical protein